MLINPLIVVCYSWGAWLGFLFTALYPEKVRKLIVIGSGSFESGFSHDLIEDHNHPKINTDIEV